MVASEAAAEAASCCIAAPAAAPVSEENPFGVLSLHFLGFVTLFLHRRVRRWQSAQSYIADTVLTLILLKVGVVEYLIRCSHKVFS